MEDVRRLLVSTAEIVDGVILHAQRMLDQGAYDWPTSRAGLEKILADLETRSVGDPSVERLRRFIALGDMQEECGQGRSTGLQAHGRH